MIGKMLNDHSPGPRLNDFSEVVRAKPYNDLD